MRPNRIKQLWREGKPATLGWMFSPDTYLAECMANAGFDGLLLDMQHGMGIGPDRAALWLQAVSTTATVPLVRVPWNEPAYIQYVLDAGAYGVIVPLVNNAEEAAKAGRSCRYPPIGFRSTGPGRSQFYAGPDYVEHANDEIICLVMVESIQTIPQLHEMAKAPGIDGFYVGPSDLALSMGILPGRPRGAEHEAAVQEVLEVAKATGLIAGAHALSADEAIGRLQQGFQISPLGSDVGFMSAGARSAVERYRNAMSR